VSSQGASGANAKASYHWLFMPAMTQFEGNWIAIQYFNSITGAFNNIRAEE
jgi:hypothetical protein